MLTFLNFCPRISSVVNVESGTLKNFFSVKNFFFFSFGGWNYYWENLKLLFLHITYRSWMPCVLKRTLLKIKKENSFLWKIKKYDTQSSLKAQRTRHFHGRRYYAKDNQIRGRFFFFFKVLSWFFVVGSTATRRLKAA